MDRNDCGAKTIAVEILRQNWEHARHVELQRLRIANFYFAVLAALLAYFVRSDRQFIFPYAVNALLIMFTLVAMMVSLRLECEFHQHVTMATLLAEHLGFGWCMGKPLNLYDCPIVYWCFSVPMFGLLYVVTLAGLVSIVLQNITGSALTSVSTLVLGSGGLALSTHVLQKRQYHCITEACKRGFAHHGSLIATGGISGGGILHARPKQAAPADFR